MNISVKELQTHFCQGGQLAQEIKVEQPEFKSVENKNQTRVNCDRKIQKGSNLQVKPKRLWGVEEIQQNQL